jgi:16S rRNA (adenine1518-N6/adenine1519-N6)-dimethyltransferase
MPAEHRARKRFGQNFLVDMSVVESIAEAVRPLPGDHLIEIGPGLAALTRALLDRMDTSNLPLDVIEIDRDLVAKLKRQFDEHSLRIHSGDVLEVDFNAMSVQAGGKLRIVGNLPYNISSPLLFKLAECSDVVVDQHFMLQREVVERMVAVPGGKDFSRLSVMLQYRYDMHAVIEVPPEAFDPPPKVHSAVVRMIPRPAAALKAKDARVFAEVVSSGYAQRRKMLRNTLSVYVHDMGEMAVRDCGIELTARAEDIPVDAWVALANAVTTARIASAIG